MRRGWARRSTSSASTSTATTSAATGVCRWPPNPLHPKERNVHDLNGAELKKGDVVLIPCRIEELHPGDDYCNVTVNTLHGRRPDGVLETISVINTAVVVLFKRGPEASKPD